MGNEYSTTCLRQHEGASKYDYLNRYQLPTAYVCAWTFNFNTPYKNPMYMALLSVKVSASHWNGRGIHICNSKNELTTSLDIY